MVIIILTLILLFGGATIVYKTNFAVAQPVSLSPIPYTDTVTIDKCVQLMNKMDTTYKKFDRARYQRQIQREEGKLYYGKDARREFVLMFIKKQSGLWKLARFGILTSDGTITDADYQALTKIVLNAMKDMNTTEFYAIRPKVMDADIINNFHDGLKSYAWVKFSKGKFLVTATNVKWERWRLSI